MAGVIIVLALGALLAAVCFFANHQRKRWATFCELMDESLGHRSYGDQPALPNDAKAISEVSIHARRMS